MSATTTNRPGARPEDAGRKTRTPAGMLSFPHLWVAKPVVQGGEPRFSCSIVFDAAAQQSEAYKQLRKDVAEAIDAQWGAGKSRDAAFVKRLRLPFRKAEEKSYAGYDPGKIFISPWTKTKPGVVDVNRQDILVPGDVWAGQIARATVTAFAYDQGGNKGVNFMLSNVQIINQDMPRMDGRRSASDEFDDGEFDAGPGAGAGAGGTSQDDDSEPPF